MDDILKGTQKVDTGIDGKKITKLDFHMGPIGSAIPILFFIIWAIGCSLIDVANEQSLIVGAVIGLGIGLFLCKKIGRAHV